MKERVLKEREQTAFNSVSIDHLDWQKGNRGIELKVDVYKEYLLWSVTALVGNVGGMLGMTMGFSFFGCIGIWLDVIPSILRLGKKLFSKARNDSS